MPESAEMSSADMRSVHEGLGGLGALALRAKTPGNLAAKPGAGMERLARSGALTGAG